MGIYTNKALIGMVGEYYVGYELARHGVASAKIANNAIPVSADFLISGNKTIEVKTSVYHPRRFKSSSNPNIRIAGWGFTQMQRSESDYIILVLLERDLSVYKCFGKNKLNTTAVGINYRRPTAEQILMPEYRTGPIRGETKLKDWDHDPFDVVANQIAKTRADTTDLLEVV